MFREEKIVQPEISRFTCDCSLSDEPFHFIRVGDEEHFCTECGEPLEKEEVIHQKVTYELDEDGMIIV